MCLRFPLSILLFATVSSLRAEPVEFNRDIRPILSDRCFYCHGPDEETREADLRLDTREGALQDFVIVPGKPEQSELLYRITVDDETELMPPPKAKKPHLNPEEVELFRRWIKEGAKYQGHWAFEPISAPEVPVGSHPVDFFIDRRLEAENIKPSPKGDPHALIRRVYLDLTGLLPTPEQVASFVSDPRPDAYERLVDELLRSPHYGERWGRHWLDGARYADSDGYSIDGGRQMWPYRDWVINALNKDMPFDQFTIEQLAGDLLPKPTKSQLVATGFHRNTLINSEGGSDPEQFRVEAAVDRTNTTGAVWLGLTVGCAQCHTHKFDPIPHREYYELFAFFNNGEDRNNRGATIEVEEGELLRGERKPKPAPTPIAPKATGEPQWIPAQSTAAKTSSGISLQMADGHSLLAPKRAKPNDAYQIVSTTELEQVAAVRLQTLTDPSLPKNGPGKAGNGNFILTKFRVYIDGKEQPISHAFADHEQRGYPVVHAIDEDKQSGWAINVDGKSRVRMNANHQAVFILSEPAAVKNKTVEVRMFHDRNEHYLIGRFALDLSPVAPKAPPASKAPQSTLAKGKVMIMSELGKPRDTYILTRGDFTRPDKKAGTLSPGVLSAIAPVLPETSSRRSRLDLANWLVHPDNPLTARVTVNRIWMRYFGRGLVETEEDFGSQGASPSHPELLDTLAHRFIEGGWSMKKIHRLIVTSETYQRSSEARPDLTDIDPRNLFLARQSRVRLDAEIIRDAALSASGLLSPKVGGPGVFPPQPAGIYAFTQRSKSWRTSTGDDRYRRAMYTFFYRSAPYPLFGTFDTPDFQTTCTRRPRSNTPLQALTLANDPAFLEFAKGLAVRVVDELPGEAAELRDARIHRAFELALCRPPSSIESKVLADYAESCVRDFTNSPDDARALLNNPEASDEKAAEAAGLVTIARAILNTDNFITRE